MNSLFVSVATKDQRHSVALPVVPRVMDLGFDTRFFGFKDRTSHHNLKKDDWEAVVYYKIHGQNQGISDMNMKVKAGF